MNYIHRLILFACLILLSSCNQHQQVKDSQLAFMKTTNLNAVITDRNKSLDRVKEIKRDVSRVPELYDVAVVEGEKNTLVVYKVKHMHRFRMKKIEKNVTEMLEKKYPNEKFTVSSDYKIFLESVRLYERMKTAKFSHQDAEKRLKEIVKMTKDTK
ncbi:sporulation protein [Neobacillus soli]|uniref:sporulation protein n=1 Tax=Neobacillus soli TaxID=220688 RepID=UPI0008265EDC|nr:sporulation protein [Neobacillus soli]